MRLGTQLEERDTHDHQKGSLNFELFIEPLVLDRVVPQFLIKTVALSRFDNTRGEDLRRERMRFILGDPPKFR